MFAKKLILIAAMAALALGSISAKDASKVHVRVHTNDKAVCTGAGQSPMSVEGVEGVYCVTGQACVANISNGACPAAQAGLPNGSHCGVVKTGVYGCKPGPAPSNPAPKCDGPGQSPMSVEGAGTYCVTGQACVANISNGACPGPQPGIPNGSHCAQVRPGVWGCRKNSRHHKHHKSHSKSHGQKIHGKSHAKAVCTGPGQSPMSVEGIPGVFCVSGQACVANIADGACPGPQEGLPNGAHCGKVITGVYGCKPNAAPAKTEAPKTEAPKTEAPKTEAPKTEAPKTVAPKTHHPKVTVVPVDHSTKRNNASVSIIIDVDVDNDNDSDDDSSDDSSDDNKKPTLVDDSDDSSDDSSDDRRQ